ncbi:MAG: SCO family protein [Chloroflexales bacterium]|nr:SCO family protein [Chloroflexales bacterium]
MKTSLGYEHPGRAQPGTNTVSPRMRLLLYSLLGLGLVLMVAALWFAVARPVKVVPRIKPMPAFLLEDQYGLPISSSDLLGRLALINFTYTGCGEACAAQRQGLAKLRETLRESGQLGREVIFLTVSFDPERDTREALQRYAAQLGADRETWRFVTGDPDELKALIGGELSIYYGKPDAAGQIEHEQEVILVDSNGIFRARYKGEALEQTKILRDIGMVTEEMGSTGMMRQVYEASHIFLCYPPD